MFMSLAVSNNLSSSQQGFTFASSVAIKLWYLQNQIATKLIPASVFEPSSARNLTIISRIPGNSCMAFYVCMHACIHLACLCNGWSPEQYAVMQVWFWWLWWTWWLDLCLDVISVLYVLRNVLIYVTCLKIFPLLNQTVSYNTFLYISNYMYVI